MFNPVQFYEFSKRRISPLLNNLISYYNGSSLSDLTGLNPITTNNGVTFTTGIIGNSFNFTGNPRFLDIADSPTTRFGSSIPFSISIWIFPQTNTTQFGKWLVSKRLGTGADNSEEYQLLLTPSYSIEFAKFNATSPLSNFIVAAGPTIPLNQWSHLVIADDGSSNSNSTKIYLNGVLFNSTYSLTGTFTGMGISIAKTRIGLAQFNQASSLQFAGRLDEIASYKNRELTQSDVTNLYNGGVGKTYPF
jgi:hypothetical protein